MKTWLLRLGTGRLLAVIVILAGLTMTGAGFALFMFQFATEFMGDSRKHASTVVLDLGRESEQVAVVPVGTYDIDLVSHLAPLPPEEEATDEKKQRGKMSWSVRDATGATLASGSGFLVDPTPNREDGAVYQPDIVKKAGWSYCYQSVASRVSHGGGPMMFHVDLTSLAAGADDRIKAVNVVLRKTDNSVLYMSCLLVVGMGTLVAGIVWLSVLLVAARRDRRLASQRAVRLG